jgi:Bacterial Ig-like domain
MKKQHSIGLLAIILSLVFTACARLGNPTGGERDKIPPKFLWSQPDSLAKNVDINTKKIRLHFNEYVVLKEISKNLVISPPIKRITHTIPSNLANKYVEIRWEDTLKVNTTYSFNFGNSIADNNEGNILPYFSYVFSTGKKIDSLNFTGKVTDALTPLRPNADAKTKNWVVGLYPKSKTYNFADKPYYVSKVDKEGVFEMNYLAPGRYQAIAFEDENQNAMYDKGKEKFAFLDQDIELKSLISRANFSLTPPTPIIKLKEAKESDAGILLTFEGQPQNVKISPANNALQDYKVYHKPKSDSAFVFFDPSKNGFDFKVGKNIKLKYETEVKKDSTSLFYKGNDKDVLTLANQQGNLLAPKKAFEISSNWPLQSLDTKNWKLMCDGKSQDFKAEISPNSPFKIQVKSDFKASKKYELQLSKNSAQSYYGHNEKAYVFGFEADKPENFGSLKLKFNKKPSSPMIIELLDSNNRVVLKRLSQKQEEDFNFLKPQSLWIRMSLDTNQNQQWDSFDFEQKCQAEPVYIFPKEIQIRAMWDVVETWDF